MARYPRVEGMPGDLRSAQHGAEHYLELAMPSRKPTPVTREDARRIMSVESKRNQGKTPPDSFSTRVDAALQRQEAAARRQKSTT